MKSKIAKILRVYKVGDHQITLALMEDGLEATGYGNSYEVGEVVVAFFFDKYNKIEFKKVDIATK